MSGRLMDMAYKATWRYYFFLVFFSLASLLGIQAIWMLLTDQVSGVDDGMAPLLVVMIAAGFSSYILTAFCLIYQAVRFGGRLLELTERGVENTLVWVNVLCFVFVLPVRCIPWEAVNYADFDDAPYIRVDAGKADCNAFARLLLRILGYHFLFGFVKPKVIVDHLLRYTHRFSVKD